MTCEEIKKLEQRYEKALDDMEKRYMDVLEQIRAEINDVAVKTQNKDKREGLYIAREIVDRYR